MIAATMDSLTSDLAAYRAAVASVLELDLEDMPQFDGIPAPMQWDAWYATELNLSVFNLPRALLEAQTPSGYWVARLLSPYVGYGIHSVVMLNGRLAHDPHPEPQEYELHERIATGELYVPMDPALPSGRFAR